MWLIDILVKVVSIYMLLIFIHIIISWFGRAVDSKPVELLCRITDPYIDWWRKLLNLRLGFIDLSPLVGIAALSVLISILFKISSNGRINIGNILNIILKSAWSIASFVLGFCVIVLVLRIFAYLSNRDIYTTFWRVIESISQPLLYKTNRLIFGNRIESYLKGIIISTLMLAAIWIAGGLIIPWLAGLLDKLSF